MQGRESCEIRPAYSRFIQLFLLALLQLGGVATATGQATFTVEETHQADVRSLVHILDYVAQDYQVAVSNGEVVNLAEFDEMVAFGRNAAGLVGTLSSAGELPPQSSLGEAVRRLQEMIAAKAPSDSVATHARAMRDRVLELTGLPMAPLQWPDLADGRVMYENTCAVCHGASGAGDGRIAPGLDPKPTNFREGDRIASQSPFQVYNTIRLGVKGTAMPDFQLLSEKELWDLAFFVKSLQSAQRFDAGSDSLGPAAGDVSLQQLATLNDAELANVLAEKGVPNPNRSVAVLRDRPPVVAAPTALNAARTLLREVLASYRRGDAAEARRLALSAYLEGVEPVEPSLSARDGTIVRLLEQRMLAVRTSIEERRPTEDVAEAVGSAMTTIGTAETLLSSNDSSIWFPFFVAASILLREGLEAFLIILAILGVLRSIGEERAARWVHGGWMAAALVGVLSWGFSDQVIRMGAAQRETMEGAIALLAVCVLLYVGFWLHSKSEIHKWKEFIEGRVKRSLAGGNLIGLAALSFFAVFREAFESVLFLSALTLEQGPEASAAIGAGAAAAIALVLGLAAVLLRYSVRLPIRNLFRYSSFVMGVLCIVLVGKGIHAFQEAGFISITSAPIPFRIDLLGFYPTVESVVAQMVLLVAILLVWTAPSLTSLLRPQVG